MNTVHNLRNPSHLTLDEIRGVIQILSFREQVIDALDTILLSMGKEALLQTAITLTVRNDGLHSVVAQNFILVLVVVKHIMLHFFILLIRFYIFSFESLSDQSINSILLLLVKAFKNFTDGLSTFRHLRVLLAIFIFFGVLKFLLFLLVIRRGTPASGMRKSDILSGVNNAFLVRFFSMLDD